VAKYISKYVSKMFEEIGRFNKKRYWSSRQEMDEVRRYVLRSATTQLAIVEAFNMLGLDFGKYLVARRGQFVHEDFFQFPDWTGFWFSFIPDKHGGGEIPF